MPQKISFCEYQSLPETDNGAAADARPAAKTSRSTTGWRASRSAGESPGADQVQGQAAAGALLRHVGDAEPDRPDARAEAAAEKFVRTQNMTPADLVAIMRYAGASVDVLQDFTADRNRLLSILETMVVGEGQGERRIRRATIAPPIPARRSARTTASSTSLPPTANWPRCRRRRRSLGRLNEKKELIYFASRAEPERAGQPGATARDRGRGDQGGRGLLGGGRARAGGDGADGQCDPGFGGRLGDVYRRVEQRDDDRASSSRRTRCMRWPAIPAARRFWTTTT